MKREIKGEVLDAVKKIDGRRIKAGNNASGLTIARKCLLYWKA